MTTTEKIEALDEHRKKLKRMIASMESQFGPAMAFQCTRYLAEAEREAGQLVRDIRRLEL